MSILSLVFGCMIYQNHLLFLVEIVFIYLVRKIKHIKIFCKPSVFNMLILVYSVSYVIGSKLLKTYGSNIHFFTLFLYAITLFYFLENVFINMQEEDFRRILLFFTIGIAIINATSVLNYNHISGGNYLVRIAFSEILENPVNINSTGCVGAALGYYLVSENYKKKEWILSLILTLLTLYTSIKVYKRTNLIIFIIILVLNVFIFWKEKKNVKVLVYICSFMMLLLFTNWQKWGLFVRNKQFSTTDSWRIRLEMWKCYFPDMFYKPFEGSSIHNPYYKWAHNIFIDVYIEAGIIVMIMLLIIYFLHFRDLLCIYKSNKLSVEVKSFYLSVGISVFLTLFTEPAYRGIFMLVFIELVFIGYCHRLAAECKVI